jgi:hypothetical protein
MTENEKYLPRGTLGSRARPWLSASLTSAGPPEAIRRVFMARGGNQPATSVSINAGESALPPRRSRKDDIPAHDDGNRLQRYKWSGNIRGRQNVIERAVIRPKGDRLRLDRAPAVTAPTARIIRDMPDVVVTRYGGASASVPIS